MISRQFEAKVKFVRSDNSIEFLLLRDYFHTQGILFQTSCVGDPEQNGRVDRQHRHILNVGRALRFHANLPIKFWGECILSVGSSTTVPSTNSSPIFVTIDCASEYTDSESGSDVMEMIDPTDGIGGFQHGDSASNGLVGALGGDQEVVSEGVVELGRGQRVLNQSPLKRQCSILSRDMLCKRRCLHWKTMVRGVW
ncbi:hypothetical protein LIER_16962 [Lithospermum erythrorhizon]|uniref:Integrase catalytic domain-containing protein n=1 Tax=Lithospermum erythrorhizon TaxID=34254 RepID=A0AAV3QCP1_LITER